MTTLRHTDPRSGQSSAPYRAGEQVFAVYTTTRGTEAGYGRVLACVPVTAGQGHGQRNEQRNMHGEGWTLIAEVGDLVLTYPLDPAGNSPRVHRPIRRHPIDRV